MRRSWASAHGYCRCSARRPETDAGVLSGSLRDLSATEKACWFRAGPATSTRFRSPVHGRRVPAATGINVTYTEDVNDNQALFAKVTNQLGTASPWNAICSSSPTGPSSRMHATRMAAAA